jgi:hypothetical protein
MTVWIADEGSIVVGIVVWPQPRRTIVATAVLQCRCVESIDHGTVFHGKGDVCAIANGCRSSVNWNLDAEVKCAAAVTQSTLILGHPHNADDGQNGVVETLRAPNIIRPYRNVVDHNNLRFNLVL